jgi:ubiquinone/menaquinone biosynthesis C-methylase UbiE
VTDWDSFFDEWYLKTYLDRQPPEAAEAEALDAAKLAGVEPGARALDAPCGYGRHTVALARAGYRVTGADRSPALLEEARRRADGLDVELVEADYRELPFPDGHFDAVFNLFTSIGYLGREGDEAAFREFRRVLGPGGRLVVETMHRDRLVRIFQPRGWDKLADGAVLLEERSFDPVTSMTGTTMTLYTPDKGLSTTSYKIRLYTATEVVEMTRAAGFTEIECYGGFAREELTTETRLVVLAG